MTSGWPGKGHGTLGGISPARANTDDLPDFLDNLEQFFHCGVGPLKVASPDADLGRHKGVHGELDPSETAAQLYLFVTTADNYQPDRSVGAPLRAPRGSCSSLRFPDAGPERQPRSSPCRCYSFPRRPPVCGSLLPLVGGFFTTIAVEDAAAISRLAHLSALNRLLARIEAVVLYSPTSRLAASTISLEETAMGSTSPAPARSARSRWSRSPLG